jgi:hypothetical protein
MKELAQDDRAHGRLQALRELFGLEVEDDDGAVPAEDGELAPVHRLPRRAARRG